jgi:hypothetical protein
MAWAGTTTEYDPVVLAYDTVKLCSTTLTQKTSMGSTDATGVGAGMIRLSTHTDVVRFPYNSANGKMVIMGQLISPDTSVGYVAVALRYPMSSDALAWQQQGSKILSGASTLDLGWNIMFSTNFASGTSLAIAFVAGPFDSAKYGHNFGGTSSNGIDKYQSYIEAMFMMTTGGSTAATKQTFLNSASSSRTELFNVCAFELP